MKRDSEDKRDILEKIIGLGEHSYRKSYYPELQQRISELERFKALLDQTNDMIFLIRIPEGRLVYAAQSAVLNLGRSSEELLNATIYDLLPPTDAERVRAFFLKSDGGDRSDLLVTALRRRKGDDIPVEITLRLVAFQDSIYCVAVARDITERKQAEDALRRAHDLLEKRVEERTVELVRMNRELERSNQALQEFASVASHDLQEPLRKIRAFGDRLRERYGALLDVQGLDYLERMQSASKRMNGLIESLLQYSRITSRPEPFVALDLNEVVHSVLKDLEVRIEQTGGTVETAPLPTIEADPNQMRQLFQNIVGNALKYHGEEPPRIKVYSPRCADGMCEIVVEDNGIGFDEAHLDKIFKPFLRLHGRGQYEGTGMGLAICQKIMDRHGGSITARSTPGKGSAFIVHLPLKQRVGTADSSGNCSYPSKS